MAIHELPPHTVTKAFSTIDASRLVQSCRLRRERSVERLNRKVLMESGTLNNAWAVNMPNI